MPLRPIDRATFIRRAGGILAVAVVGQSRVAWGRPTAGQLEHPEPREGITSDRVLAADALGSSRNAKVLEDYEAARTYPAIFDGIACACSCGGKNGMHRSLLVCFETMQPTGCAACQEEAEIAGRLARAGKPLDEIRKAVDKWSG
jgi:hypothetical protein